MEVSEIDKLRLCYEKEKKERLSLQVELVSTKHARDLQVAGLKAENASLQKSLANMKLEIESLREELASTVRSQASSTVPPK